jgi:hypothetical protein
MSARSTLPRIKRALPWAGVIALAAACGAAGDGGAPGTEAAEDDALAPGAEDAPQRPSLRDLGPGARRVKVIVLPGDAEVEVDGLAARRRDGVIELAGKPGDRRRLRVFKGSQSIERVVTIEASGASPPRLDLLAKRAAQGAAGTASSAAPVAPLLPESME